MPLTTPDPALFVNLMVRHEPELRRGVLPLLGSMEDARDAVQDAALTLWQKFGEYDPALPFLPWAKPFARYAALTLLKKRRRYTFLTDELVGQLVAESDAKSATDLEERREALDVCLAQLPAADRRLIEVRYADPAASIQDLAGRTGEKANVLYKSLARIRRRLLDCVTSRLAVE